MIALSASTEARPQSEMVHSMTVQLLRFCTTVTPMNSLVSQKPASLTWLRNSEPEPMASTSSDTCDVDRCAATGWRMPDAVTVATVADPVATRIRTATSQASRSGETLLPLTQLAMT